MLENDGAEAFWRCIQHEKATHHSFVTIYEFTNGFLKVELSP